MRRCQSRCPLRLITALSNALISLKSMTCFREFSGPVLTVSSIYDYRLSYSSEPRVTLVVSVSLQYSPTQCTIVASYKWLVVGVAFLSSPEETYLTYLVVRPGWENVNIARYGRMLYSIYTICNANVSVMLYHLIAANPRRDITLHVSANNPAMVCLKCFQVRSWNHVYSMIATVQ
jgi:hypothetical protein